MEFIDLITRMLAYNPQERLSYQDIITHPWMQGPVVTQEELQLEFQNRLAKIQEEAEKLRQQKEIQRAQNPQFGGQSYRSGRIFRESNDLGKSEVMAMSLTEGSKSGSQISDLMKSGEIAQINQQYHIQQYAKGPFKWSQFLSSLTPEDLMNTLVCWISKNSKYYEEKDKCTLKAKFDVDEQEIQIAFKLYQAGEFLLIDMIKEYGPAIAFQAQVKKILEDPEISELSEGQPFI